ncbi:YbaB/EbfC family nucleoid-associated protein [Alphaproteobacteria bacterium]|nr:YbaB/EbfC family nucleoid-associated protein [Alphaproteobacteria bacterium]
MMRNMAGMMKKVQEMQGRMENMQADLAVMEFTAMVGGGAVSATVSGDGKLVRLKLVRLKLDPAILAPDDVDMLEDMICLATNNALDEAAGEKARLLKDITGGLPLPPGMNLPF